MHYEVEWGDLKENKKFQKHLEKEPLYEFLVGLNKDLDEYVVGFLVEGHYHRLEKPLQRPDVKLANER